MNTKTPGDYVVEIDRFPDSVVEVATAVPAFVGYTEKAEHQGASLHHKPWRITTMAKFIACFGGAPDSRFSLHDRAPPGAGPSDLVMPVAAGATGERKQYWLVQEGGNFLLHASMLLFFANGGGACYIVAVGAYGDAVEVEPLLAGVTALQTELEPTILVVPDAVLLKGTDASAAAGCITVQQAMLHHCGAVMKNRFAILDVANGYLARSDTDADVISTFRERLGDNHLSFAAAYYPWLDTTVVPHSAVNFLHVENRDLLQTLLTENCTASVQAVADLCGRWTVDGVRFTSDEDLAKAHGALHQLLTESSPLYVALMGAIATKLNRLPPSGAMAGVYSSVDHSRGVWKAPANVSLNCVTAPVVHISDEQKEDLNVSPCGKSINAIRAFAGAGLLVWGARTLDGNSLDWRYINVRRTMLMLEESLRRAVGAYAFEPNTANTWVTVKGMINNFLNGIWRRGGLAGATAQDAFSVFVGLGETMSAEDILEGRMNVTILVALSRPAEFIEITLQQKIGRVPVAADDTNKGKTWPSRL